MIRSINIGYKMLTVAIASLFSLISTSALAEKIAADTPLLILGSEIQPTSKVIGRGDVIVSSRIVYARLAIANEDIYGSDGKVVGANSKRLLLAKGAQMFGVVSNNGQITYCSVDHKPVGALDGVFVINRDKQTCFIDKDGDGLFESSYDLRTKFTSVPIYYDVEIAGNPISSPVGYTSIDPSKLTLSFEMEAILYQISTRGTKSRIMVGLKSDGNVDYLKGILSADMSAGAVPMKVFGAEFTLARKDDAFVDVNITNGIQQQEFTTRRPDVFYQVMFY
jgi:hypothetical protein